MKFKRGYQNGARTLEIIDGNLDVVLYHEDESGTFYFYRFNPDDVLNITLSKEVSITDRKSMVRFLSTHGFDYDTVLNRLLTLATESNMKARYDM